MKRTQYFLGRGGRRPLMVGCSIALVIYLWKDLEQIAYSNS